MAYDTDLTPLLAQCTDEDLNTLVEYIKEKGGITENLTIHEDYKKYNPQHSKYMPVIVVMKYNVLVGIHLLIWLEEVVSLI